MMLLAALACVALPLVVIPAVPHPKARHWRGSARPKRCGPS